MKNLTKKQLLAGIIGGKSDLSRFVNAYLQCALWSSNDESNSAGGEPMDKNYSISDFTKKAILTAYADCESFIKKNESDLAFLTADKNGHNFGLNRNGHGSGFWDEHCGMTFASDEEYDAFRAANLERQNPLLKTN